MVLVTGGTGYIGSHTAVELLNEGKEVLIVDNLSNSSKSVIDDIEAITNKRPYFIEMDIRNEKEMKELFKFFNFESVVHFAGL